MKYWLLLFCFVSALNGKAQQRFDVLIDEIMADPAPPVNLPNAEFVELKNVSGKDINLQGWRLTTTSSQSGLFPSYILPADSFIVLTSTTNAATFASYGRVLGIPSFPSLANDGATLNLLAKDGKVIHFVTYSSDWYQNEAKAEGGWSLEMIDTHNPCAGKQNWKASINDQGGTPGKKNSVDGVNKDDVSPSIKNFFLKDNSTLVLQFAEPVDSASVVNKTNYTFAPALSINLITINTSGFAEAEVKTTGFSAATVYQLAVVGIKDCAGNEINSAKKILVGLPQEATALDIIINEVLFNPKSDGYDYVELYNRSKKIVDASKLYIANRNSSSTVSSLKKVSDQPRYLFPGEYIVITENAAALNRSFLVKETDNIFELSSLPSMPDDKGTVVLTNVQGSIIDKLNYSDNWHFDLLADEEGVALERIDPETPTQDQHNWHSAASTAGFGTPSYRNSQYKQTETIEAMLSVSPKTFSPDNDGYEDIATIQYGVESIGYVANIYVFDITGKTVRHLVKNATLALKGNWTWDGLDEKGKKLPVGNYIIYTELFNLQGKKKSFKNVIVLARRLN